MPSNPYKNASFFKLALRFFLVFFIAVSILRIFIGVFKFDGIGGMVDNYFANDNWKQFLILQGTMALLYGLFLAGYYKFIKK